MLESLFNKVTVFRPAALLKKYFDTGVSCEFGNIFKNTFLTENLQATASDLICCNAEPYTFLNLTSIDNYYLFKKSVILANLIFTKINLNIFYWNLFFITYF